jgi:glucose dehydrogenase
MKPIFFLLLSSAFSASLFGQTDWPVFLGDPGGTRFTPVNDINPGNVANLKVAWKADLGVTGGAEVTPIEIGGVVYVSSPRQVVFALDAATGRELWRYDPKLTKSSFHRGISYWPGDKNNPPRIVAATTDARLYVLDAKKGTPIPSFGDNGVVNLRNGIGDKFPDSPYGPTSPPARIGWRSRSPPITCSLPFFLVCIARVLAVFFTSGTRTSASTISRAILSSVASRRAMASFIGLFCVS